MEELIKTKERNRFKIFIYYDFEKRSRKIPNEVLIMNPDENNFQNDPFIRLNATLPFNFKEGACGTFSDQDGVEFALLCFDREDPTTCYTCNDLENGICEPKLESVPTRKTTRNAIRIGKYQGRMQMPIQNVDVIFFLKFFFGYDNYETRSLAQSKPI